jgi:hypothetical protein
VRQKSDQTKKPTQPAAAKGSNTARVKAATYAGVLRLFHVGLFHTVAPLCNSLRNDVASMETYSSWMNCPKENVFLQI